MTSKASCFAMLKIYDSNISVLFSPAKSEVGRLEVAVLVRHHEAVVS